MTMPTIPRILATTALCLAANSMVPLQAAESLSYLHPEQAQRVIDIYRQTPELREEYESRCNWVFVPMLYLEITPDCYLLCVEVGSGASIYLFSLVKKSQMVTGCCSTIHSCVRESPGMTSVANSKTTAT